MSCWPPAPTSKQDFYPRWRRGDFGNRIRMFDTYQDLVESKYRGNVVIRYKEASSPYCRYGVPYEQVESVIQGFVAKGAVPALFTFNEPAPDNDLLIQGEFYHDDEKGYALFCSTEQTQMRRALKNSGRQFLGLQALGRMQYYLNDNSYQMMTDLLDTYPGAVIEFSVYGHTLGTVPGHNTIIWEVRNY